ncbi:hypothetical protein [Halosimplex sp. TS25]|uniref:hypothetical protein n=1 Tax=Halosimplex rarum TaxID=3396619 RepID=UPI0039E7F248
MIRLNIFSRVRMPDSGSIAENISSDEFLQQRASNFQQAANDARSLIRTNLIIVGLFLPVIASLFSGEPSLEKVFNNPYTQVGLLIWGTSTAFLTYTYHRARNAATDQFDPIERGFLGKFPEGEQKHQNRDKISEYTGSIQSVNIYTTGCMMLSLVATSLLALGVLLPYVSFIPQMGVFRIIGVVLGSVIILYVLFRITRYILNLVEQHLSENKGWDDLTEPRQDLFKKLYVAVGDDSFQKSELPMKDRNEIRSIQIGSTGSDEPHVLLEDLNEDGISGYLLEQLVEDQYFEKKGESDELAVRRPYGADVPVDEADQEIKAAIDKLAIQLEHNEPAREHAASEIGVRPEELFHELRSGSNLRRVERYNRVVEDLEEEDFDISSTQFEYGSDEVTYVPTDSAHDIYDKLKKIEQSRERKRKLAEREEEIRKSENTYLFLVIDPVDENGNIGVATNGLRAPKGDLQIFNLVEAQISDEERQTLENLEADDEIRLRIETHPQTMEKYIASVGGP